MYSYKKAEAKTNSKELGQIALLEVMVLEGNIYRDNSIGTSRAVVGIEGFPNVRTISEKYVGNENWFDISL